jgi:glycosyltransferase involved in cell wall biosynthesis
MKLIYIANARIPTEKAHGKQIVKTCEAFAKKDVVVELWLPKRKNTEGLPFDYYGVSKKFLIKKIPSLDLYDFFLPWPKFFHLLALILQEGSFCVSLLFAPQKDAIIYTRSLIAAIIYKFLRGKNVFYEIHNLTENKHRLRFYALLYRQLDGIILISNGLKNALSSFELPNILVSPDGVDPKEFLKITKEKSRKLLNLAPKDIVVAYSGSFHQRKGVYTLAQSAKLLKGEPIRFIFVGGTKDGDLEAMENYLSRNSIQNVTLTGFVAPNRVPLYLRAADILVLPSSGMQRESREFTSPMKLFEYLAAGVPIVASDTLANSEILIHGVNAYLVKPDSPKALATGIQTILKNKSLAVKISKEARKQSSSFSWDNRVSKLLDFMSDSL